VSSGALAGALALVGGPAAIVAPASPPASAGERAYQKCYACHALAPGESANGPNLGDIVGRPIAAEPGFAYSPALQRLAAREGTWTEELLDRFIADPEAVAPGNEMGFVDMRDADERAALLAWLRSHRADEP
jgi:cytochrome c